MKLETAVLFALVLVASGCASNPSSPSDPAPSEPGPETSPSNTSENATVITYTDSGFQPETVTVKQGDTVVWESEASRSMWVGSDQHPVHSEYAGTSLNEHCSNGDQASSAFDQCSSGDRFSFTFEKEGEWGYHNHDYSSHTGTVIVE